MQNSLIGKCNIFFPIYIAFSWQCFQINLLSFPVLSN
uniref:Uncharacterized protein MANES_12G022900 n=1 Tax=Rhizophora mucronata TaxID=61149 RepID=A0A2P2ILD3_RHIMU